MFSVEVGMSRSRTFSYDEKSWSNIEFVEVIQDPICSKALLSGCRLVSLVQAVGKS